MLILHSVLQCCMLFSQIVRSVKVTFSARINLTFVRVEKWPIYIFHGWPNMCATSKPLELQFHAFLVVLLTTRKCHNSHGDPLAKWTSHLFHFHVKAFWSSCLEREHHWSFSRCSRSNNSFNEATSSRFQQLSIQRASHDVITPSPPPHPPSVNNNDTCNVTTSSTKQHLQGFNKSQSNAVHMTLLVETNYM